MSDVTEKASSFAEDLSNAARRNPMSAAMIGMGVLWLFAGGGSKRAGDLLRRTGLDRLPDNARDTLDSMKAGMGASREAVIAAAGNSVDALRESGADAINHAAEVTRTMPDPGQVFVTTRTNLSEIFNAQPLALGVIGLAIGAGIAAALPKTNIENTYLGEASETVRSKTADIAGHQVEKATKIARDVAEAAAEEARQQGLTPEGAKAAAGDVVAKIGRVADAARKGVSERTG